MSPQRIVFNCFEVGCNGGYRVILELASRLSNRGYSVTINTVATQVSTEWFTGDLSKVKFNRFFPSKIERLIKQRLRKENCRFVQANLLRKKTDSADINVATACLTAKPTAQGSQNNKGFYLVQHYEPWFFSESKLQRKAEESYDLPLKKLCVSEWLAEKVNGECIGSGVNTNIFHPMNSFEEKEPNSILYLYRAIPWKGDVSALILLQQIYDQFNEVKIHIVMAGTDAKGKTMLKVDFPYTLHQNLDDYEMAKLYSKCRVMLYAACFEGKGLPPLEALACGTNVASTAFFGNDYLKFGENCADFSDESVIQLLKDDKIAKKQIANAKETVARHNYEGMVDNFIKITGA